MAMRRSSGLAWTSGMRAEFKFGGREFMAALSGGTFRSQHTGRGIELRIARAYRRGNALAIQSAVLEQDGGIAVIDKAVRPTEMPDGSLGLQRLQRFRA